MSGPLGVMTPSKVSVWPLPSPSGPSEDGRRLLQLCEASQDFRETVGWEGDSSESQSPDGIPQRGWQAELRRLGLDQGKGRRA